MSSGRSHRAVGLTVETIAEAGLELIRDVGVDGVTMRLVAERLDVRAPTLYHHVAGKDELLALVARRAFEGFGASIERWNEVSTGAEWVAAVLDFASQARVFYLAHPGLAGYLQAHPVDYRNDDADTRNDLWQAEVGALVRLGLPPDDAHELFSVGSFWTLAAIVAEQSRPERPAEHRERLWAEGLQLLREGLKLRIEQGLARSADG